ncbi:MAG: alpha/beta hydrolase family protein [Chitinophagaceae bacterium]
MKQHLLTISFFLIFHSFVNAAKVDTVVIFSSSMQKQIKCVVIKPALHGKNKIRFPTVYLLHGYAGWYANWILRVPELKDYADAYGLIIVCPDGDASWYFDSPVNANIKYETFISKEVPRYIDSAYRTITDRDHRAITGLSMGGHGALFIAWKHANTFAAAGSMSGGVDLSVSKNKYGISKVLGDTLQYSDIWRNSSVLTLVETKPSDSLALIIDDGISDIFIEGNRKLHQKLLTLKIPHEYIERPGGHNWEYWKYAIHFQLLFFRKFFDTHQVTKN